MSRARARLRDPGFFALARAPIRRMIEHCPDDLDGDDIGFYALLALEANSDDPTRFPMDSVADLAAHYGLPVKRVRNRLRRLSDAGWIEWTPARNDETPGLIRLLVNVEHGSIRREVPPPDREGAAPAPDRAPDVALPSPPPDREGATRRNATQREQRTENTEENGTLTVARGATVEWRVSWKDIIRFGYEYHRDPDEPSLRESSLTGFARVLKDCEDKHGPKAAAEWLTEAFAAMANCSTRQKPSNAFSSAFTFGDHLDAAHPLMVLMKTYREDLWTEVRWQDDGLHARLVWPGWEAEANADDGEVVVLDFTNPPGTGDDDGWNDGVDESFDDGFGPEPDPEPEAVEVQTDTGWLVTTTATPAQRAAARTEMLREYGREPDEPASPPGPASPHAPTIDTAARLAELDAALTRVVAEGQRTTGHERNRYIDRAKAIRDQITALRPAEPAPAAPEAADVITPPPGTRTAPEPVRAVLSERSSRSDDPNPGRGTDLPTDTRQRKDIAQ